MDSKEILPGMIVTRQKCVLIEEVMVIADLHIGYEAVLENEGIHMPRMQTAAIRDALIELVDRYEPDRIAVLGDFKHEFSRNLSQEWEDVRYLLSMMTEWAEVTLIRGNHDNYLANICSRMDIPLLDSTILNGITLVHGHQSCDSRPLLMAHEHPSIRLFDAVGAFIRLPCFLYDRGRKIVVMPAFSPLAMGTDLTMAGPDDFLSPLLKGERTDSLEVYACSDIGLLDMGTLSGLRSLGWRE